MAFNGIEKQTENKQLFRYTINVGYFTFLEVDIVKKNYKTQKKTFGTCSLREEKLKP